MFVKIINYIKKFLYFFMGILNRTHQPKNTDTIINEISCKHSSVKMLSSSSVVLHIETDDVDGFFFECRKHTDIKKYVKAFIDDYFLLYCEDYPEKDDDKTFILNSLKKPENFKKFITMGSKLYNVQSGCMSFLNTGDGTAVGLETQNEDTNRIKRLQKFVGQYAWCQLNSYNANKYIRKNSLQTQEANVASATLKIAKLLNLDYLIPESHYTTLNIVDKKSLFGFFVKTADGCSILPYTSEERKSKITPSLQYDLTNLNVLDVITYEQDHSPNNYNVIIDDSGLVTGIRAFDNKGNGTFALKRTIDFKTFKKAASFMNSDGTINRPFISNEVYISLKQITLHEVYKALNRHLNPLQIYFCWKRIQALITAIDKSLEKKKDFTLLKANEWSEETISKELSGSYGKTYLVSFYSDVLLY